MPPPRRILRHHDSVLQVLEEVLKRGPNQSTTVIVCSTQEDFFNQLINCIDQFENDNSNSNETGKHETNELITTEIPASQEDLESEHDDIHGCGDGLGQVNENDTQQRLKSKRVNQLLIPTLHQLSTSRNVRLVFCPTISVFRAFISVYNPSTTEQSSPETPSITAAAPPPTNPQPDPNIQPEPKNQQQQSATSENTNIISSPKWLTIIDLIHLHSGTSENTLQGLSRTLSSTVSTAHRNRTSLELIECKDVRDPTNPERGSALWDASVPLLSGSVKVSAAAAAAVAAGAGWAGRVIPISRIVGRWFEFC